MKQRNLLTWLLVVILVGTMGCSSIGKKLKSLVGAGDDDDKPKKPASFASTPYMGIRQDRAYKKVNKQNFADDQGLEANAGSLWKKEGQSAFLFTQNNLRTLGDIINVKIEDRTAQDLSVKADTIRQNQIAQEKASAFVKRKVASVVGQIPKPEKAEDAEKPKDEKTAAGDQNKPAGEEDQHKAEKKEEVKFDVAEVPTRITERFSDGSFRVKGMQTFMIGKKEYRVLVTGLVKSEDVNQDVVSSTRVLDGKFELVQSSKVKGL